MGILWWKKDKSVIPVCEDEAPDPDLAEAKLRTAEVLIRGHRVSYQLSDRLDRNGFTALAARIFGGN